MKKFFGICLFLLSSLWMMAGVTTYEFTNVNWGSRQGTTTCDGSTDGWKCVQPASDYSTGYINAQGNYYSRGVSVKTGSTGAGAISVRSFTGVRKLTFNFCQNASKGQGVIHVQVGENPEQSLTIHRPAATGEGVNMRDSVIEFATPLDGKIYFWVDCSENAININSITIRAKEGGSTPFTTSSFQLVNDPDQLQDSDQIIIGVHEPGINYIMGYFDESVSQNNIHAIQARYSDDRQQVAPNDAAIYTIRRTKTKNGLNAWFILDQIRYEDAYLVASGGQTKNRLALWDKPYDSNTYGEYGYWDMMFDDDGTATIINQGNSKSRILQYNASNSPTLFSCYAVGNQTSVCVYREVAAIGDVQDILAPMVNFGTVLLQGEDYTDQRTITISANRLTEDIRLSLRQGTVFSLSAESIDQDGDLLTISCRATQPGHYRDTLVMRANGIEREATILLTVVAPLSVGEAIQQADYTMTWLSTVVVTKKYDHNIYVRDETGSMLIYDNGNGEGGRYGSGLENGDVLTGVTGRFQNYYGVPEIAPSKAWKVEAQKQPAEPERVLSLDSADVCRFVLLTNVCVIGGRLQLNGQSLAVTDKFDIGITEGLSCDMSAIVSWDYDVLTLYPVAQTFTTDLEENTSTEAVGKMFLNGQLLIRRNQHIYNALGQSIQ